MSEERLWHNARRWFRQAEDDLPAARVLLVSRLPDTMEQVTQELHAFADTLENIASDC